MPVPLRQAGVEATLPTPSITVEHQIDFRALTQKPPLTQLATLLKVVNKKFTIFVLSICCSFGAAFFESVSLGLLVPVLKGIMEKSYVFENNIRLFDSIPLAFTFPASLSKQSILGILVTVVFLASILKITCEYVGSLNIAYQVRQLVSSLQSLMFKRYLHFGKKFFDNVGVGKLYAVLTQFTSEVSHALPILNSLILASLMIITYVGILLVISWKLTLVTLIIFPLQYHALNWLVKKIKASSTAQAAYFSQLSQKISNVLGCFPLIKSYSMEREETDQFTSLSQTVAKVGFSIDKKNNLISPLQEIITLTSVIMLVLLASILIIDKGAGAGSEILVYFLVMRRAMQSFSAFSQVKANFAKVSGYLAEIFIFLDERDKAYVEAGNRKFSGLKEEITFNHLTFSYREDLPVLREVSFSVHREEMTAIVGPTGSGKTTIINLLQRLYDCPPASIYVDGVDIREFSLDSLRKHIAVVSQDPLVFRDTFKNNLMYGLTKKISNEEMTDVLRKTRLYDFVMSLPDKLETIVGDRGILLSGGEKQRLSIARAILKGADILFLDEATSALDSRTERLVQQAIDNAIKDRTTIVIAHRLSTIKRSHKIIVLENGTVAESGTLDELLRKNGRFNEYWQEQKFV